MAVLSVLHTTAQVRNCDETVCAVASILTSELPGNSIERFVPETVIVADAFVKVTPSPLFRNSKSSAEKSCPRPKVAVPSWRSVNF
ncbi:MAG: hypothetical protein ACD_59C00125G0004 [uncultured bacterium]|nr:MAG: hypothetical protein ACD_59C00125G0004 [uncultured bacterium]